MKNIDEAQAPDTNPIRVAGEPAVRRLMKAVDRQARFYLQQPMHERDSMPTPIQVAIVLHALADHTAIMEMLKHRPDETSPWKEATSVGRWFHDVGSQLENL